MENLILATCKQWKPMQQQLPSPQPQQFFFFTDCSKEFPLLQFFFVHQWFHMRCLLFLVFFFFPLFVPHLSFWCLGKAFLCDCGISWVSSLIFWPRNVGWFGHSLFTFDVSRVSYDTVRSWYKYHNKKT